MASDSSPPAPLARAVLVIDRPAEIVRAQFFDTAHAIEKQIYHGIKLSWAPPAESGMHATQTLAVERGPRVRREMIVLGRPLVDDVSISEGEGGTWVVRFIEGANAGARFVATFDEETAATDGGKVHTRVELQAFAPAGGFSLGVGKLSPLGLEKMLQKTLAEHQRAIEGYDAKKQRRVTAQVLASMEHLTAPLAKLADRERKALVSTLLEAACAVAIADSKADEQERDVLDEVARALGGVELDDASRGRLVRAAEAALLKEGMEKRCEKLGARLKKLGCAELSLTIAVVVAEVSHGIDPPELAALEKIAAAAGVPEAGLSSIVASVDKEMAGSTRAGAG
jgi:tellurite resistance protein